MFRIFYSFIAIAVIYCTNLNAVNFRKVEILNMSFVLIGVEKPISTALDSSDLKYDAIAELLKSAGADSSRRVTIFLDYKYSFTNPALAERLSSLDEQIFASQDSGKEKESKQELSTYNKDGQQPLTARTPVVYSEQARILYGYVVGTNTIIRSNESIINIDIANVDAMFYQSVVRIKNNEKDKDSNTEVENTTANNDNSSQEGDQNRSSYQEYVNIRDKSSGDDGVYKTIKHETVESFIMHERQKVINRIQKISPNFPNQYGALIEIYDSELETLTYYLIGVYRGDFIKYMWTNNR